MNDVQNRFRLGLLKLAYSYARLVALSLGFQHVFGKNNRVDESSLLQRVSCHSVAFSLICSQLE
jgi:hypothetical protein